MICLRIQSTSTIFNRIFEDNIASALLNNTELINKMVLSGRRIKRSSDGWYLVKNDNEKYEVGKIDADGKKVQFLEFSDKRNACAVFIKREIDELRDY